MDHLKIKVCGMRDQENIREVAALGPDYMGFICFSSSPRYVGEDFKIPAGLPRDIKKVGVFVNETIANVVRLSTKHGFDMVQLHGTESVEMCKELRQRELVVIKVFPMHDLFDFDQLTSFKGVVDYFLFDTKGPFHGGNGVTFDWNILNKYDQEIPFFHSGGISPASIKSIPDLKGMKVHALDLNSGVEQSPGLKDLVRIKQMLNLNLK